MAACIDIREDLKAYLDGELANGRRSAVRAHVDGCRQCARELSEIERYSTTLRALDHAEPRPELRRRILASLPHDPAPVRKRSTWLFPAWGAAAAAAAIAGFIFYRPPGPTSPGQTRSAATPNAVASRKSDDGKEKKIAFADKVPPDALPKKPSGEPPAGPKVGAGENGRETPKSKQTVMPGPVSPNVA